MRSALTSWTRGKGARSGDNHNGNGRASAPASSSEGGGAFHDPDMIVPVSTAATTTTAKARTLLAGRSSTAAGAGGGGGGVATEYPMGLGLDESPQPPSSSPANVVSPVSTSSGETASSPSASSVETGPQPGPPSPRQQVVLAASTPSRGDTGGGGLQAAGGAEREDDHPLSPRYLSYRSSLASRLGSSSASSSPVRAPSSATTAATTTPMSRSVRDLVRVFSGDGGGGGRAANNSPPRSPASASVRTPSAAPSAAAATAAAAATTPKSSGGRKGNPRPASFDDDKNASTVSSVSRSPAYSTPTDEDRSRRIAAAMLVSDSDDDDGSYSADGAGQQQQPRRDRESVRDRLNRRLEKNQAGSTPIRAPAAGGGGGGIEARDAEDGGGGGDDDDDAVIAGQAAVAALAATYSSLIETPGGTSYSPAAGSPADGLASPLREFTVHNSIGGGGGAAANRSGGLSSGGNISNMTPLSSYSATSSLTDPNFSCGYSLAGITLTPGGAGATPGGASATTATASPDRLRSWNNFYDPAMTDAPSHGMLDVTADPILGPQSSPLNTTLGADEFLAKIGGGDDDDDPIDHETSLLGVASGSARLASAPPSPPRAAARVDAEAGKSPTCALGPAVPQEASRRRERGRPWIGAKPCSLWALLGGGVLLLVTAVALAIAFLVTRQNGGGNSAPSPLSNGTSSTAPEENDPDWAHLYPSFYPAEEPSPATNATEDDDDTFAGSLAPAPSPAGTRPTRAPYRRPSRSPAAPPPTVSAEDRELLDGIVRAYGDRLGSNPNATAEELVGGGSSSRPHSAQRRAFSWLARSHDGITRRLLGIDRLVQRFALATFFYATNGTVLDRIGDDDYYYQYVGDPGGSSSWLGSGDECDWLSGICRQGWVTNIKLGGEGLLGSIPPELALLAGLEELNLSENNLRGTLPPELGTLTDLRRLNLRDNGLTGTIPTEFRGLESVEIIRLDGNGLEGSVPQSVCQAYYGNFNLTQSHPQLYLDCGGANPKITCPPGICCTYCCAGGRCDCVFADSALENDLC